MTIEQFQGFLRARPFVPFAIQLADTRELRVEHPDAAMLNPPGRTAAVINPDQVIEIIDLPLVTSLRPLNGRAGGGRSRRASKPR